MAGPPCAIGTWSTRHLALDRRQRALLAVLLLRGPQTLGELRLRTDRMAEFEGLDDIEHELAFLGSREEPLAASVGRRLGQKEERWASPIVGAPTGNPDPTDSAAGGGTRWWLKWIIPARILPSKSP